MALAGGYRGAIAGLSPALVIAMALIGSTTEAEGHARFVTTAGALMASAVTTGVFCLMLGRYRLANLVRFIPFPVAGGFVAGIGGAVCLAALSLMGAVVLCAMPEPLRAGLPSTIPRACVSISVVLATPSGRPAPRKSGPQR